MNQSAKNTKTGMGWLPDYPDFRDYTAEQNKVSTTLQNLGQENSIKSMLSKAGVAKSTPALPASTDLRQWCSPVEHQLTLGCCTAHAGIGIVEYFERRAFGKHIDASRMFLYKTTRNLLKWRGDSGAFIRSTMAAMVLFGVPPEEYWPYVVDDFDKEPSAFCYAYAQNFQAISYYRLDPTGTGEKELLQSIKTNLSAGIPAMFGFTAFSSIVQAKITGMIPFPTVGETIVGGHAVVAVGYDDSIRIKTAQAEQKRQKAPCSSETPGATNGVSKGTAGCLMSMC